MLKKLIKTILFLLLFCSYGRSVNAQNEQVTVRVGTKLIPPFVFEQNGKYVGFSMDLWQEIADELNWKSELYGEETLELLLDSVSQGRTDIAIAGITINSERETKLDFSHSFFESGLQILVSSQNIYPWEAFFAFIFSPILWSTVLFLVIVTAIAAHIVWFFERKNNPAMFPEKYVKGIGEAFWWAVVTVVTVGYGDKTPVSVAGRILATIWMFTGVLLISYFTASVSSALTVQRLGTNITNVQDLQNQTIGTVTGSTANKFLDENTVSYLTLYDNINEAYKALEQGKIKAIVYDAPVLQYYSRVEGKGKVKVVGSVFAHQSYGIAVKINSPYREQINQALLKLKENGTYQQLYREWFGTEY